MTYALSDLGAHPVDESTTEFRVWAPRSDQVTLHLVDSGTTIAMQGCGDGYFCVTASAPVGSRYLYQLDDGEFPDPVSRSQPEGVHGPSAVVDLAAHHWQDDAYHPRPLWDQVIYELHVGTFSPAGTFEGALSHLDALVELGIGAIEVMPVASFPGERNWGYDGVFPFAVQHSYGGAPAFQEFVDACHQRDLAVVLDVVYNHLGPEGNIVDHYAPYFSDRYRTLWGSALNFDGPFSDEVRRYFWQNARQWFVDFHVDALRLDAIDSIADESAIPFVAELSRRTHELAQTLARPCVLIAETAANDPRVVTPLTSNGLGMDAQWNDDFHHALHVALTGERTGYYADYSGADDLATALDQGFALQGTPSVFRHRRLGAPSGHLPPDRFVVFSQNHDQIGNRPLGNRLSTMISPDQSRLAAALVLLSPNIPLLFMGEEYGEEAPFPYFVDHGDEKLIAAVREGRAREFPEIAKGELLDPGDPATFNLARLDHSLLSDPSHREIFDDYRRLIALRRSLPELRHSTRSRARAWANGTLVTLARSSDEGEVYGFFNLGANPMTATLAESRCWRDVLEPASAEVSGVVEVEPWSYRLFRSEVTR
ncbi:MAG: malto-oligosyltrehalose trehalohydrolase [Acidimicrobiales bacterium]